MAHLIDLRWIDWRFLLPKPAGREFEHLVLLGGSEELADAILACGLARRVSLQVPSQPGGADALILLHRARLPLDQAARCLRRGGVLYWEVARSELCRAPCALSCLGVRLHRARLAPLGIYWAAPSFEPCSRYLPLDVPGAFRWYMRNLYVSYTPRDWLVEGGVRLTTGSDGRRFAPFAPRYAVVASAGAAAARTPAILQHADIPPELRQPDVRPLILTSGVDAGSRSVVLPFTGSGDRPLAVLKVSRLPQFNVTTEREHATLEAIRARLRGPMVATIPRPLGLLWQDDLAMSLESCAPGRSLVASSGRWWRSREQKVRDLRMAADWLVEFQWQMQISRNIWDAEETAKWVHGPLEAYATAFGVTASEDRLFAAARSRARALVGQALPIVWLHNDFGPWNVFRDQQQLTVLDWEWGPDAGPALCDLIYFVTHWAQVAHGIFDERKQLACFFDLFVRHDSPDFLLNAARSALEDARLRLGIAPGFLPILHVYTWVDRALDHLARKRSLAEAGPDPRAGNRFVRYIAILASHAERLFG